MLTEKGLNDDLFCSMLWTEVAGNSKRQKPDRSWSDDTLSMIHQALTTTVSNKKAFIEKTRQGFIAKPYGESDQFWVVIDANYTTLLLTLSEVLLEKESDQPWQVTVLRFKDRKPSISEQLECEKYVRRVLARAIKEVFRSQNVKVVTQYKGDPEQFSCQNPTEEQLKESDEFLARIQERADGERALTANTDLCYRCWYKQECKASSWKERKTFKKSEVMF